MAISEEEIGHILRSDFFAGIAPHLAVLKDLVPAERGEGGPATVSFPKICTNCGKLYQSPENFLEKTQTIRDKKDVCYLIKGEVRIFRYRNCDPPCSSTLVITSEDRRDMSPLGEQYRRVFGEIMAVLGAEIPALNQRSTHSLTLYLFRMVRNEVIPPREACGMLLEDLKSGRFTGFNYEEPLLVEEISK